ncbi:MAG: SDR family NAD(P)-dependent oxidoreductase, partial [Ignavibacteriae bacterium]|nr:SDR family NAD(P)-dependent oxidoreductase [Ignavibacteriota bacterium]
MFEGKTSVVTGGTGALGHIVVERFLSAGANVVVPYRSATSLSSFQNQINNSKGKLLLSKVDLSVEEQVEGLLSQFHFRGHGKVLARVQIPRVAREVAAGDFQ